MLMLLRLWLLLMLLMLMLMLLMMLLMMRLWLLIICKRPPVCKGRFTKGGLMKPLDWLSEPGKSKEEQQWSGNENVWKLRI